MHVRPEDPGGAYVRIRVMPRIAVRRLNWREWPGLAADWERIHGLCPEASFFLSREWVDCWLATFGASLNPEIILFLHEGSVAGCCLLVWRTQWVRGIPLRRVYLNCAGEDDADSTCIEYNSLVCLPEFGADAMQALGRYLKSCYWDELMLQGLDAGSPLAALAESLGSSEAVSKPARYVDICRARREGTGFDAILSSNTRQQIRRSQKLYEQASGPCTLRIAQTRVEALEIFARLAELHQAAWTERGRAGAFASPRFTGFHKRLIETAFERRRVLLMEVRAGEETIGALYSLLHNGRVCFYQSGFRYASDGRLKPGLVSHYLAIRHCFEDPSFGEYDFGAGDSQYKRSLASAAREVQWIVVRRRTPASLLFRGLRWMKRAYVEIRQKSVLGGELPGGSEPPAHVPVPEVEAGPAAAAGRREP